MALIADQARSLRSDDAIVERIVAAVMGQRLRAGAKLPEGALCDAFQCNRTQIRRILVVLAERGVVTLHANRGAFVSSPDAAEAHEVFEARRAVERPIVLLAAERIDAGMLAGLRANVRDGAAAEARGDRSLSIRLSGEFHLRLAEVAGNSVLTKFLGELVARTSLIIGVHGSHSAHSCSEVEHQHLTDALERRDAHRAAKGMEHHLRHIESTLDIGDGVEQSVDIVSIFTR
jgi:DNA-binding GntR family transcriptional regulator